MIVYEVTATVADEHRAEYERYIRDRHIPDLMKTGCFDGAAIERSAQGRYRVRYIAPSRDELDRYMTDHAPRLRADFVEHFPSGADLSREEWIVLETFA